MNCPYCNWEGGIHISSCPTIQDNADKALSSYCIGYKEGFNGMPRKNHASEFYKLGYRNGECDFECERTSNAELEAEFLLEAA